MSKNTFSELIQRLKSTEPKRWLVYIILYFIVGMIMNEFGAYVKIAKFTYWWQVISCYILYMVPISIVLRPYSFFSQYAYGLVAMGVLEFGGYALGTSYIYPDNILEQWFGPHVFALGMTLFFGLYFPAGNWAVDKIYSGIFKPKSQQN